MLNRVSCVSLAGTSLNVFFNHVHFFGHFLCNGTTSFCLPGSNYWVLPFAPYCLPGQEKGVETQIRPGEDAHELPG